VAFASRPSWATAPAEVRRSAESICGVRAVACRDVHGGMSPGPAAVLSLADGRDIFVKAVSERASAWSHRAYLREAATLAALPVEAPAPALLGRAEPDDWVVLVMSAAPGRPAGPPWTPPGIVAVTEACETIGSLAAPRALPPIGDILTDLDGWQKLAATPDSLDRWETRHAPVLARLAAGCEDWTAGTALVHQDIRADNAIVDPGPGRATIVDWSYGCSGAAWLDRARLAADIVCTGHRDGTRAAVRAALDLLGTLPAGADRFVVALAGMWRYRSTTPELPGYPTLRAWQYERAQGLRPLLAAIVGEHAAGSVQA
jgi:hypothetical protein